VRRELLDDPSGVVIESGITRYRTFPAAFPIWGIDHVLANRHARFCEYRTLDGAPSDHRLQLARLGIR